MVGVRTGLNVRRREAIGLLLAWMVTGCAMPVFMGGPQPPPPAPADSFKVLTYNTLHGLAVGRFWVRPGETSEEQAARFALRIRQLGRVQPDLIFLQEVNPLPQMVTDYVLALKEQGLSYSEVHQVDACGLRIPGAALIPGLNNGLAILVKAPYEVRKLEGVKLSGTIGGCRDSWGIQLGELRYALLAEVWMPGSGMRFLAATMHLHSGIERDAEVLDQLSKAHMAGRVMHYDDLMAELVKDQDRRVMELHSLMHALERYQAMQQYAGVIIGGDLNFEPGSPEYRELELLGYQDTATLAAGMPRLNTYDPMKNPVAGKEEGALPPDLSLSIAGETPEDQQAIVERYRNSISMPRRIDFLFSMAFMSNACLMQELFGEPTPAGQVGSDHYGVLNTYSYRRKSC